jgi:Holliday junction resolvase RusA-like endonuclease
MITATRAIIDPMGAPRMTSADTWRRRPCVLRYRAFKDTLRLHFRLRAISIPPAPVRVSLQFLIPVPVSWSPKKISAHIGKPCKSKPDIDNLCKAVLDGLWPEADQQIHDLHATKKWDSIGSIILEIET